MPPPPALPPQLPQPSRNRQSLPATSSSLAATAGTSRALLGQLEELRDNLSARVEQLSGAVDRLRSQAGELERALAADNLNLDRLSLRDDAMRPRVNGTSSQGATRSNNITGRTGYPQLNPLPHHIPHLPRMPPQNASDNPPPISQARLGDLLDTAATGPVFYLPQPRYFPDLSTDPHGGYVPLPIPEDELARMSTPERDVYESIDFDPYYGAEAIRHRENLASGHGNAVDGQDNRPFLPAAALGSEISRSIRNEERNWSGFLDYIGLANNHPPAPRTHSAQHIPRDHSIRSAARSASPAPRRMQRDTHRVRHTVAPERRGLTPTNLVSSQKTNPIIVRSTPLSPARTITPDDHIREDIAPLRHSPPTANRPLSVAPVGDAPRPVPGLSVLPDRSRITREVLSHRAANSLNAEPRPEIRDVSPLTLRGQEVAARESGNLSAATSLADDYAYDMDDFERDYYLDFNNDLGAMIVAPGTGFAMPHTGSPIDLPRLASRSTPPRTAAEVVAIIRREEGERMRALASDIVRHRPHTPSTLSREVTPAAASNEVTVTAEATEDGASTPRAAGPAVESSISEATGAGAAGPTYTSGFVYVSREERERLERAGRQRAFVPSASPQATSSAAAPDPALRQETRPGRSSAASPSADPRRGSSSDEAFEEIRERTLAAQVQLDITRERIRNIARSAATASEREALDARIAARRTDAMRDPQQPSNGQQSRHGETATGSRSDVETFYHRDTPLAHPGAGLMERALDVAGGESLRTGVEPAGVGSARRGPQEVDLAEVGRPATSRQGQVGLAVSGVAGTSNMSAEGAFLEGQGEASSVIARRAARGERGAPGPDHQLSQGATQATQGSSAVYAMLDTPAVPSLDRLPVPTGRRTARPYVSLLDLE